MSVHLPKTRALEALNRGHLSAEGADRLRAHLRGCAICQQQAEAIHRYRALLADVKSLAPPRMDIERLQGGVLQVAVSLAAPDRRSLWRLTVPALAAAVALGLWLAPPSAETPAPAHHNDPVIAVDSVLGVRVLGAMGQVHWTRRDEAPVCEAGSHPFPRPLTEGGYVVTGPRSVADLELSDGTRLRVGANSELQLTVLRRHEVALWLQRGELFQAIPSRDYASRYRLRFSSYEARVLGTRFSTLCDGERCALHVEEGRVELRGSALAPQILTAHSRWSSHRATSRAALEPTLSLPEDNSRLLPAATVEITLPAWPAARWLEVDALRFPFVEPLRMHTPPQHAVDLRLQQRDGTVMKGRWLPDPQRPWLSASDLRALLQSEEEAEKAGVLSADTLQRGLAPAHRDFQRCFEQALRENMSGHPQLRLRVRLDPGGSVQRAEITGERVERSFRRCLLASARRLHFPSPGGPLSFEVPLNFRSRASALPAQRRKASTR